MTTLESLAALALALVMAHPGEAVILGIMALTAAVRRLRFSRVWVGAVTRTVWEQAVTGKIDTTRDTREQGVFRIDYRRNRLISACALPVAVLLDAVLLAPEILATLASLRPKRKADPVAGAVTGGAEAAVEASSVDVRIEKLWKSMEAVVGALSGRIGRLESAGPKPETTARLIRIDARLDSLQGRLQAVERAITDESTWPPGLKKRVDLLEQNSRTEGDTRARAVKDLHGRISRVERALVVAQMPAVPCATCGVAVHGAVEAEAGVPVRCEECVDKAMRATVGSISFRIGGHEHTVTIGNKPAEKGEQKAENETGSP